MSESRPTRAPGRAWWVLGALATIVALVGVWTAVAPAAQPTQAEQVRAVSQTLRCPTCIGEDVADSAAPIAEAMRLVVAEQVAEGRSAEEIQGWFAQRYGDDVLLEPPRRGAGWSLWLLPLGVLGAGAAWFAREHLRQRRAVAVGAPVLVMSALVAIWLLPGDQEVVGAGPEEEVSISTAPVLDAAVAQSPGSLPLRLALARSLEEEGRLGAAADEYAAAVRLAPMDADMRYRHAFTLVRDDRPGQAEEVLIGALQVEPDHPPSLLLLGSLRQQQHEQEGSEILQRFLEVAPDHPSADQVRQWLEGEGQPPDPGGGQ